MYLACEKHRAIIALASNTSPYKLIIMLHSQQVKSSSKSNPVSKFKSLINVNKKYFIDYRLALSLPLLIHYCSSHYNQLYTNHQTKQLKLLNTIKKATHPHSIHTLHLQKPNGRDILVGGGNSMELKSGNVTYSI